MFYVLLIIFFSFDKSHSNHPILIAKPYPFNRSETSRIECFSNEQGIILSLTIIATMLDMNLNSSSLQSSENNISKNGSIILMIPAPFNYSKIDSKIECRSKYYHGEQKIDQLDVLSVVEIPQKELVSINTYTKQMVTINCLTYGTNVFIHWNFSRDLSKTIFGPLPIGIRIYHQFTMNDTLIIDHVSYSDHRGYYQCYAINQLLGRTYEDNSVIYLNVKKNTIWISIVIACVIIGICILILVLGSKCYQRRRKNQLEEKIDTIKQIVPNREPMEFKSSDNIEESIIQQDPLHFENSSNSSFTFKKSLQFILNNPFLDPNVQLISSVDQHSNKQK